jgi:hypothetical protein
LLPVQVVTPESGGGNVGTLANEQVSNYQESAWEKRKKKVSPGFSEQKGNVMCHQIYLRRNLIINLQLACLLGMFLCFFASAAKALPANPPPGPYHLDCRGAKVVGTDLRATCLDFFGKFRETHLNDYAKCTGSFTDANGKSHPRNIFDIDGELRCVVDLKKRPANERDPGSLFDIISISRQETKNGEETTSWRIDRPKVWDNHNPKTGEVEYPMITFKRGDFLLFNAGGCVQTGGTGSTWKSYLNPRGGSRETYYAGTVSLPGITLGQYQRLNEFVGHSQYIPLPQGADPNSQPKFVLQLGYQDNQLDDNGYYNHDDGNYDQCKNTGPAWVEVTVTSGAKVSGPILSRHSKPFDLVWDLNKDEDENGLPINPQWNYGGALEHQAGAQPHFIPICGAAFQPLPGGPFMVGPRSLDILHQICTSMSVDFDLHTTFFTCPSDPINGHLNFGIATFQGKIAYTGHSLSDEDWEWDLTPRNGAGLAGQDDTPTPGTTIHMEVDGDEVPFDSSDKTPFWNQDFNTTFASPDDLGLEGVAIGQLSLDGVHGAPPELHPLYAMAVLLSQNIPHGDELTQTWGFFLRNSGDEGYCSTNTWTWPDQTDFFIPLEWPERATGVTGHASDVVGWQGSPTVDVQVNPTQRFTYIHLGGAQKNAPYGVAGTFNVTYKVVGTPMPKKAATRTSPSVKRRSEETEEPDVKHLSSRIADPSVRARFVAEVNALPARKRRPTRTFHVDVSSAIRERKHVPGAASRGEVVRARPSPDSVKLAWDAAMLKILQTYQKDLKMEAPTRASQAPPPAAPLAPK